MKFIFLDYYQSVVKLYHSYINFLINLSVVYFVFLLFSPTRLCVRSSNFLFNRLSIRLSSLCLHVCQSFCQYVCVNSGLCQSTVAPLFLSLSLYLCLYLSLSLSIDVGLSISLYLSRSVYLFVSPSSLKRL